MAQVKTRVGLTPHACMCEECEPSVGLPLVTGRIDDTHISPRFGDTEVYVFRNGNPYPENNVVEVWGSRSWRVQHPAHLCLSCGGAVCMYVDIAVWSWTRV